MTDRCTDCRRTRDNVGGKPKRCPDCTTAGDAWTHGLPQARSAAARIQAEGGRLSQRVLRALARAEAEVLDPKSLSGERLRQSLPRATRRPRQLGEPLRGEQLALAIGEVQATT